MATSAASVRSFSTDRDLLETARNSLLPSTMQICVCLRSWYRAQLVMESENVAQSGTRSSDFPRQHLFNPTIANYSPVMTLNDGDT